MSAQNNVSKFNWHSNQKTVANAIQNLDPDGNLIGITTGEATTYTTAGNSLSDGDAPTTLIILNGATAAAGIINWTPTVGRQYVFYCTDGTVDCGAVLSSGITWDGTNNAATFADAGDCLIVYAVTATRLVIVENLGAVAFSSV
jgi:hypothetical protein